MRGTICGKAARDTPPREEHEANHSAGGAAEHRRAMIVDADLPPEADTTVVAADRFARGL